MLHSSGNTIEEGVDSLQEQEDQGACCETVFPGNVGRHTHYVSRAWLPNHELNKYNSNRRVKMDSENPQNLNPTQRITGK